MYFSEEMSSKGISSNRTQVVRCTYIENLKKAILECIANPGEVIRRGKNARKKAEKYTWQEKNKKYQAIYEELLKK